MKPALPRPGSAPSFSMALMLASLSMVSPLSIDTFFPSFREIAAQFDLTDWEVQQLVTAYMLPFACLTLVHGPLSDALGRRRVVIIGMLFYAAASIGCVFAPSFGLLIAFRAMQGMAAGIGPTVARAVVRDLYEGAAAQRLMSLMMMIFLLAPAVGPIIGGWIHVAFGWRAVFGLLVLLGVALSVFTWLRLPETHPPEKRAHFELGSLAATSWGLLTDSRFLLLAISSALCMGAPLIYMGAAPQIVLDTWGLGETQFHHLFVPVIGGFMIASITSNRTAGRVSRERQLRIGFAMLALGSTLMALLQQLWPESPRAFAQVLMATIAFGGQYTFPILTLEMLDLAPRARGAAASVQSFVGLGGLAIIMGMVAPAMHGSLPKLALITLGFAAAGFVAWNRAHRRIHAPAT